PVLHRSEGGAVEGDLVLRVAAVPHGALVPGVAERVEMSGRDAVVEDSVVVERGAALSPLQRLHEVLRRKGVVDPGLLGERPGQRHDAARPAEPGGLDSLPRRDQIDGSTLVIRAPASPVAAIPDPALDLRLGRQPSVGHLHLIPYRCVASRAPRAAASNCGRRPVCCVSRRGTPRGDAIASLATSARPEPRLSDPRCPVDGTADPLPCRRATLTGSISGGSPHSGDGRQTVAGTVLPLRAASWFAPRGLEPVGRRKPPEAATSMVMRTLWLRSAEFSARPI